MSIATATSLRVAPSEVHGTLKQHMLADGYGVVLDLERSHGSWLYDSLRERELLDFFTNFSSYPMGYNHPKLLTPEVRERLLRAAVVKPSNADLYTPYFAEFVATFARTVPAALPEAAVLRRRRRAGDRERPEGRLRLEGAQELRRRPQGGDRPPGHPLPPGLPRPERLHHVAHQHRPQEDRATSPSSTGRASTTRRCRSRSPKRCCGGSRRRSGRRSTPSTGRSPSVRPTWRRSSSRPIQAEGGDNHFRPEFLRALRQIADEHEVMLVFDEVQTGFATTGRWWCFEHFGVEPDLFAFGKKTQQCGIASTARVDEVDSVFKVSSRINSTWGGNLVDMVRCQRFVEIIEEDDLLENAAVMGRHLLAGLRGLEERLPRQGHQRPRPRPLRRLRPPFDRAAQRHPQGDDRERPDGAAVRRPLGALPAGPRRLPRGGRRGDPAQRAGAGPSTLRAISNVLAPSLQ